MPERQKPRCLFCPQRPVSVSGAEIQHYYFANFSTMDNAECYNTIKREYVRKN